MKDHNIAIEQVTARQHSAHGLVERRMAFFNQQIGLFDVSQAGMTKIQASNYMRSIAARLNDKPYGLRFLNEMDIGPRNQTWEKFKTFRSRVLGELKISANWKDKISAIFEIFVTKNDH